MKPEVRSDAPVGYVFPAPHVAPVMVSPLLYQGMKRTHDNTIMDCKMSLATVVTETR